MNKKVLIISPEPWSKSYISKHHYANKLVEWKNEVFFLNPPVKRTSVDQKDTGKAKEINVIDYKPLMRGINSLNQFIRSFFSRLDALNILKMTGKIDVVWSFDPFRFQHLEVFDADLTIYHAADVHNTALEKDIANAADLVFAVSDLIKNRIETKKPIYFINHGLSDAFLKMPQKARAPGDQVTVGFIGNKQKTNIDFRSIKQVVTKNKDLKFVFIGPDNKKDCEINTFWKQLKSMQNVVLVDEVHSKELVDYLVDFDIFILSSKIDDPVSVSNSHKLLEYLSTGKVVVSHYVDQYKNKEDLVIMANQDRSYAEAFSLVVNRLDFFNDSKRQEIRREYARLNSYTNQLLKIDGIIKDNRLL